MVDVWDKEVGRPFRGGGMVEEGFIAPVLMVSKNKVTNVGHNELPLCAGQHWVYPGEVSNENIVPFQEKI